MIDFGPRELKSRSRASHKWREPSACHLSTRHAASFRLMSSPGLIKANFPSRISLPRVVQDRLQNHHRHERCCEQLLGRGDMLFPPPGTSRLIQCSWCVHRRNRDQPRSLRTSRPKDRRRTTKRSPNPTRKRSGLETTEGEHDELFRRSTSYLRRDETRLNIGVCSVVCASATGVPLRFWTIMERRRVDRRAADGSRPLGLCSVVLTRWWRLG